MKYREEESAKKNIERFDNLTYLCLKCSSTTFTKSGTRAIMNGLRRQLYKCQQCKYRFSLLPKEFAGHRSSPEVIMEAMYMYMRGMSSRNVARQIKQLEEGICKQK